MGAIGKGGDNLVAHELWKKFYFDKERKGFFWEEWPIWEIPIKIRAPDAETVKYIINFGIDNTCLMEDKQMFKIEIGEPYLE